MRGTVFNLIATMIGVGFLTLPTIGKNNGWVGIILMVFLSQSISLFGNIQLMKGYRATGKNNYSAIVEGVLGVVRIFISFLTTTITTKNYLKLINKQKYASITLFIIFLYILTSAISYYIFAFNFAWAIAQNNNYVNDDNMMAFQIAFTSILYIFQFQLCIPRKISQLRHYTMQTACIILFVSITIVCNYFQFHDYFANKQGKNAKIITFNTDYLYQSYCLSLFSAVNHFGSVNVISELKRPSSRRLSKTIIMSYIFPVMVYITVGVLGYMTVGSSAPDIIINRKVSPDNPDILMSLSRLCIFDI